jgi:hypothetical protein
VFPRGLEKTPFSDDRQEKTNLFPIILFCFSYYSYLCGAVCGTSRRSVYEKTDDTSAVSPIVVVSGSTAGEEGHRGTESHDVPLV